MDRCRKTPGGSKHCTIIARTPGMK
jgi:hypothetical protein